MDQMLKQRLIGAIVIIALAVIFIPMILEGPDKELSTRTRSMPPPPAIDYQTEVELPVPAATSEAPEPAGTPVTAAPEQDVSALPESATPPAEPAAAATAPVAVKPVESAAKPPVPKPPAPRPPAPKQAVAKPLPPPEKSPPKTASVVSQGGWVLQVGSFTQQANAQSLRDRLKKSGYQVTVQVAKGADGSIHRVLVGPVSDRTTAEKLRDKLARDQKLTAMVLENK
jgi:DedD protein